MSTKHVCDVCGCDINSTRGKIAIPCHLIEADKRGKPGYINEHGDEISGRDVDFDLCPRCSNAIYDEAAKALLAIQQYHGIKQVTGKIDIKAFLP